MEIRDEYANGILSSDDLIMVNGQLMHRLLIHWFTDSLVH